MGNLYEQMWEIHLKDGDHKTEWNGNITHRKHDTRDKEFFNWHFSRLDRAVKKKIVNLKINQWKFSKLKDKEKKKMEAGHRNK